ncbi:MAG: KEOPS complex subunit Cgi121 [Conexivisphaerales archaeon]
MKRIGPKTYVELRSFLAGEDPTRQLAELRKGAAPALVQTLDSSAVAGREHLLLTLKQSVELKGSSQLLADRVEVDFLLRVAGTRQISKAVRVAGSQPGNKSILVVWGSAEDARSGLAEIRRLVELKPFKADAPGKRAASRVNRVEMESVVGGGDVVSRLLAEKAALLRR